MEPLPPNNNPGGGVLTEYLILLILSLFFVVLRSYVRLRVTKSWGWDDTTIIIAWLLFFANIVLMRFILHEGLGRHAVYLENPKQQILQIIKYNVFFQTLVVICTLLTKISISILILRIKNTKRLRWILWTMMIFMTVVTISLVAVELSSCIPLRKVRNPEINGICIHPSSVYGVAYTQSAFNVVSDMCLTISPIVILWNVSISKKKKILICLLMSLGLTATISTILRNVFTPNLKSSDFTHDIVPVTIVVILEMGLPKINSIFSWYGSSLRSRSYVEQTELRSENSGEDASSTASNHRDPYTTHAVKTTPKFSAV